MTIKMIDINIPEASKSKNSDYQPSMTIYLPTTSELISNITKRKTLIICPGGAYTRRAARESEPVVLKFMSEGFNVIILNYSVSPATFPTALCELATAVSIVRENAQEWNVDEEQIIVGGFSAGGHLAGSLGVYWHSDFLAEKTGLKNEQCKPNALMLGYPVTSLNTPYRKTFDNLLGGSDEFLSMVSLDEHVTKHMPKTFMWHTDDDGSVPVENSLLLALAMKKHKIPLELHIFKKGVHGLSLASELSAIDDSQIEPNCQIWTDLFVKWTKWE